MKLIFSSLGKEFLENKIPGLEKNYRLDPVVYSVINDRGQSEPVLQLKKIERGEKVKYEVDIETLVPFLARSSFLLKDKSEYIVKFRNIIYDSLRNNSDDMVKLFIDLFVYEVDSNPLVCEWLNDAILPCVLSRIGDHFEADPRNDDISVADPLRWAKLLQEDVLVNVRQMIDGKFEQVRQIHPDMYVACEKAESSELICELAKKMSSEHWGALLLKIGRAIINIVPDIKFVLVDEAEVDIAEADVEIAAGGWWRRTC